MIIDQRGKSLLDFEYETVTKIAEITSLIAPVLHPKTRMVYALDAGASSTLIQMGFKLVPKSFGAQLDLTTDVETILDRLEDKTNVPSWFHDDTSDLGFAPTHATSGNFVDFLDGTGMASIELSQFSSTCPAPHDRLRGDLADSNGSPGEVPDCAVRIAGSPLTIEKKKQGSENLTQSSSFSTLESFFLLNDSEEF